MDFQDSECFQLFESSCIHIWIYTNNLNYMFETYVYKT